MYDDKCNGDPSYGRSRLVNTDTPIFDSCELNFQQLCTMLICRNYQKFIEQ